MSDKSEDSKKTASNDTIEISISKKTLGGIAVAVIIFAAGFFGAGLLGGDSMRIPGIGSIMDRTGDSAILLEDDSVTVYFFWGDGCSFCDRQKPYIEDWADKYPDVKILDFETWSNPEYSTLFRDVSTAHGISAGGVPTTFIGNQHWIGFDPSWAEEMEAKIESCLYEGCDDPARDVLQNFLEGKEASVDIEIPVVALTVLDDETCSVCESWDIVESLKGLMGPLDVKSVDISSFEGKEMVETFEVKSVPAYIFSSEVTSHPSYAELQLYLDFKKDAYLLRVGGDSKLLEREASTEPTIGFFSMSMCPYGTMAGDFVAEIVNHFDGSLNFDLFFIAAEYPEGFDSMRGQPEIDENIRQLCLFENEYEKFTEYLLCINEDISNAETRWSSCAERAGIAPAVINDCVESGQGEELLRENIKIAEELEIGGSPTFLINNQILASGLRPAEALVEMICDSNPELRECEIGFEAS